MSGKNGLARRAGVSLVIAMALLASAGAEAGTGMGPREGTRGDVPVREAGVPSRDPSALLR
jgi:hypothetical protein